MAITDAPRTEVGHAGTTIPEWSAWIDPLEEVAALRWPQSVHTYHKMRNDSQVDALLRAIFLPVRRRRWVIDPQAARDEVTEHVASTLNLPVLGTGDTPRRSRKRFNHDDHLRLALLAMAYGHMFFEQFGEIQEDESKPDYLRWIMRRLGVRLPQSISEVKAAADGGLVSITQFQKTWPAKPIPVSQLVAYVWDREGANWLGRSALRPLYRHWLVKDRLIRIDAMKNERYGVGIPTAKAPQGARDVAIYGELAKGVRAGEDAGVGLPYGADVGVEGIRGALPDTIGSIKYHDQAMARNFLEMFLELGQTETGSRALGESFIDFFDLSLDAVCTWYSEVTSGHVIEDIVDWNFGEDEDAPSITWEDVPQSETLGVDDLASLIERGLIDVDDEVKSWVRSRFGLPAPSEPGEEEEEPEEPGSGGGSGSLPVAAGRRRAAAAAQTVDRPLGGHREPNDTEVRATTDFDQIQQVWQDATESLVAEWSASVRPAQIDALVDQIAVAVAAGSADALASVSAPVLGTELLALRMLEMAEDAVTTARAEAAAQGVTIELIDTSEFEPLVARRAQAVASLMARSLSDAAARNAILRYGAEALPADVVAAAVREHLEELSDAYLNDQLGGALTQAQNTGRRIVMGRRPCRIYASELNDANVCVACKAVDGREYATVADAEKDYPTGGHAECLGGPRCRGTLVAVYEEAAPSVIEAA